MNYHVSFVKFAPGERYNTVQSNVSSSLGRLRRSLFPHHDNNGSRFDTTH